MGCGTRWFVFSIVMLSSALGEEVIKLSTLSVWIHSVPKNGVHFYLASNKGSYPNNWKFEKKEDYRNGNAQNLK